MEPDLVEDPTPNKPRRDSVFIWRLAVILAIPIATSLPELKKLVSTSYEGANVYWLPLWCFLGFAMGGLNLLGELFSEPVFLSVLMSTFMFGIIWAYWFFSILDLLSFKFNRKWTRVLLALFWLSFALTFFSNGLNYSFGRLASFVFLGVCFMVATGLEIDLGQS